MKVLFVEDEPVLMQEMLQYFGTQGHLCESATTYFRAVDKVTSFDYDLIVLDLRLPDGSGLHLIPHIKKKTYNTGLIILTANNTLNDKLEGFKHGADDYLTKPFYVEELNARINAVYNRKTLNNQHTKTFGGFALDTQMKTLSFNGEQVTLTKKEYQLLLYFLLNADRVMSKSSIAEHIWGDHFDESDNFDAIYVHLTNLRKKLARHSGIDHIVTVYGLGYKFFSE
ncbi:response regulator transcription factor [Mucilaginibacter sp. JRF]|uniref:response regulator transcription factor n=1 Tax=Mucilaginibacter sp. JRF TaxID=2780088 RepID=UPI00187E9672|nr:response regulator transcription factor [Mucilaginibacter sp. JRF]MBE9583080.1 response regulator transcription factor [Mucilaginibacter sp. JRF]